MKYAWLFMVATALLLEQEARATRLHRNVVARLVASDNGIFGAKAFLRISQKSTDTEIVVFRLEDDGHEGKLWSRLVSGVPDLIRVGDFGALVILRDTVKPDEAAVEVFSDDGAPLKKYKLADLLTNGEIADNTTCVAGDFIDWLTGDTICVCRRHECRILLGWGKELRIAM